MVNCTGIRTLPALDTCPFVESQMCPMPEVIHELTDALQSATDAGTPLLVTGEPGTGMTTALAALTVRYKEQLRTIHGQEKALVFTHFVGNSANFSTDLRRLLLRMCSELDDYFEVSSYYFKEHMHCSFEVFT